jgi:DNA-directed RNA polymerase beta subunit
MPFCPLTGITADVVISSLGFVTRMLMSQLVSTTAERKAAMEGLAVDASNFTVMEENPVLFGDEVVNEECYGPVTCGMTGKPMARCVMGITKLYSMRYIAKDQASVHGEGAIAAETHTFGNRFGMMEKDHFIGAGVASMGTAVLLDRTAFSIVPFCTICGTMQVVRSGSGDLQCINAVRCGVKTSRQMVWVKLPYTGVTLVQVLAGVGIDTQFHVEEIHSA